MPAVAGDSISGLFPGKLERHRAAKASRPSCPGFQKPATAQGKAHRRRPCQTSRTHPDSGSARTGSCRSYSGYAHRPGVRTMPCESSGQPAPAPPRPETPRPTPHWRRHRNYRVRGLFSRGPSHARLGPAASNRFPAARMPGVLHRAPCRCSSGRQPPWKHIQPASSATASAAQRAGSCSSSLQVRSVAFCAMSASAFSWRTAI
ncbi:hypothetical protein D3C81_1463210 [compost metagenome]